MADPTEVSEVVAQPESKVPEVQGGVEGAGKGEVPSEGAQEEEETLPATVVEKMLSAERERWQKEVSAIQKSAAQQVRRAELKSIQREVSEGDETQQVQLWAQYGQAVYANELLSAKLDEVGLTREEVEAEVNLTEASMEDVNDVIHRMVIAKAEKIREEALAEVAKERETAAKDLSEEVARLIKDERKRAGLDKVETSPAGAPPPEKDPVAKAVEGYLERKKSVRAGDVRGITVNKQQLRKELMSAGLSGEDLLQAEEQATAA